MPVVAECLLWKACRQQVVLSKVTAIAKLVQPFYMYAKASRTPEKSTEPGEA